ncbi:molybdenum ABC transporter ATP-binding protein [Mesorhizobium xinjiangense]|uniref:molybdenum ABC transporter ATP-binding protein n=1 Tax=Mesorhizobium xinjiangense TaxID=2678685 RepID=UPI0012ED171E|nr:molybdenum ABC transporter ATP-binding protein [Mesorhizobium xinjiangense]
MTIEVDVSKRLGKFELDLSFASSGKVTALFGPSGAGKTSAVNLIAGLARPDTGRIAVGGTVLVDTSKRIFVPRHRRRVGYVFQDARLFPHLTVRQNLLYGRWFSRQRSHSVEFDDIVAMLGVGHLLARRPGGLSGGERQRVAIGRALLSNPALLLLDEPLASLDDARKAEIMPYLERLRDETRVPIVHVSHSVGEVARLADYLVVLSAGRAAAAGPLDELLPRLGALGGFERHETGSVVDAVVEHDGGEDGLSRLASPLGSIRVAGSAGRVGRPVRVRIRARDVLVATQRPDGLSALNILAGVVAEIGNGHGPSIDVRVECNGVSIAARITRHSGAALDLKVGKPVFAVVKGVALEPGGPSLS